MIKVGDKIVNFDKFNDGTCYAHIDCSKFEPHAPITWLYDSDEEVMQLWHLIQHCKDKEGYRRPLCIPYIPNARQDRTKNPDDVFTLKYFAQLINALHLDEIDAFDLHSDVGAALINHIHVQSPAALINSIMDEMPDSLIFYPDEGAYLRYRGDLPVPSIFGIKQRNWEDQHIEKLVIGGEKHLIANHNILIVDDICGSGKTIKHAATQLKKLGANKIYVYVSHCENTVLEPHINGQSLVDIPDLIEKIYTTNSIYRGNHPKIEVIYDF